MDVVSEEEDREEPEQCHDPDAVVLSIFCVALEAVGVWVDKLVCGDLGPENKPDGSEGNCCAHHHERDKKGQHPPILQRYLSSMFITAVQLITRKQAPHTTRQLDSQITHRTYLDRSYRQVQEYLNIVEVNSAQKHSIPLHSKPKHGEFPLHIISPRLAHLNRMEVFLTCVVYAAYLEDEPVGLLDGFEGGEGVDVFHYSVDHGRAVDLERVPGYVRQEEEGTENVEADDEEGDKAPLSNRILHHIMRQERKYYHPSTQHQHAGPHYKSYVVLRH